MTTIMSLVPALEHGWPGHPESPNRIIAIKTLLDREKVTERTIMISPVTAVPDQIQRVHSKQLVDAVAHISQRGGGHLDADTYTTSATYAQACMAAGTTCAMLDKILNESARNGIALVRPPGHHANQDRVGGFCLFNNVAVGVRHAQSTGRAKQAMIIDFDVHHGNGTQDIFYDDPSVCFASLHLYDRFFYPGSGSIHETGAGEGKGTTMNIPFGPGAGDQWYLRAFRELIAPKGRQFKPDLMVVSAGFDAHWADPLAMANLSLAGYDRMTRGIIELADEVCGGKVLFVLEGGYHLEVLSHGVLNVINALTGSDEVLDPLGPSQYPEQDMSSVLEKIRELHLLN